MAPFHIIKGYRIFEIYLGLTVDYGTFLVIYKVNDMITLQSSELSSFEIGD